MLARQVISTAPHTVSQICQLLLPLIPGRFAIPFSKYIQTKKLDPLRVEPSYLIGVGTLLGAKRFEHPDRFFMPRHAFDQHICGHEVSFVFAPFDAGPHIQDCSFMVLDQHLEHFTR